MLFQYCKDCIVQSVTTPAVISAVAHALTAAFAICAYFLARRNLQGLSNNQTLQAEMHLFGLEKAVISDMSRQRKLVRELDALYNTPDPNDVVQSIAIQEKAQRLRGEISDLAKELSHPANRLAHLMDSHAVSYFFPKRPWEKDYLVLFKDVVDITESLTEVNVDKVKSKLEEWAESSNH